MTDPRGRTAPLGLVERPRHICPAGPGATGGLTFRGLVPGGTLITVNTDPQGGCDPASASPTTRATPYPPRPSATAGAGC
ncbi:hypothetical protein [Nocardia beijingensis]|uniref:hypothetical protein n=1 Tax=Nocardia beijingensis TaxID=95162 RepID=UPI0033A2793F